MGEFKKLYESSIFSTVAAYNFAKLMAKQFEDWDAFKLGLIDENGKIIKKAKTAEEKKSIGVFENLARKIKVLFHKFVPNKKYLSLLIAMYLIKKESVNKITDFNAFLHQELESKLTENEKILLPQILNELSSTSKSVGDSSESFFVGKDLEDKEAFELGLKRCRKDHRGYKYNKKTGVCKYI